MLGCLAHRGLLANSHMTRLGSEFMPPLNEGTILDMPVTIPRASITEVADDLKARDALLRSFPEVSNSSSAKPAAPKRPPIPRRPTWSKPSSTCVRTNSGPSANCTSTTPNAQTERHPQRAASPADGSPSQRPSSARTWSTTPPCSPSKRSTSDARHGQPRLRAIRKRTWPPQLTTFAVKETVRTDRFSGQTAAPTD